MDLDLQDKVIIVTGGAKGIGAGISRVLAAEGAIPVMVSKAEEAGRQLVDELATNGKKAHHVNKLLGTAESCREAIAESLHLYGRIDGLVNNAGANDGVGLESGTPEAYYASLEYNLHHYYFMAHYALPELKKSKGPILNISSKTALTGQGGTSAYAAAKGAQLAFTREWAVELLPHGIRVNAIVPAEVMTPLYAKWLATFDDPLARRSHIESRIPFGKRMTTTGEMGATAAFLLSNKQSGHTTGQFFFIDGGYVHLDRAVE